MEKRPFWWSIVPSNLTAGLIVIIAYLALNTAFNLFAIFSALSQGATAIATFAVGAAIYAVAVYGLYKVKRWGRLYTIAISVLMVVAGFLTMLAISMTDGVFMVVTHGLIAIYLLSQKGRKPFYPEPVLVNQQDVVEDTNKES